jgi:Fur family zinc uptake transcriptional regulator
MNNNQIVLKIIRNNKKALSAYDILDKFQRIKRIQPMTVYRSLNTLIKEGYVRKSEPP